MKKWIILLLTAALLLQTACSERPRIDPSQLEGTMIKQEEQLDTQKEYPAERPAIQEEIKPEQPKAESTAQEEQTTDELPVQPSLPQIAPSETPQTTSPEPPALTDSPKPEQTQPQFQQPAESTVVQPVETPDEVRAVWFSYFELEAMLQGQSESAFTKNIGTAFDNVAALGLNTIIMQVRPYADAVYPSEFFPWSYLAAGTEGEAISFDPLKIMVREAHNRGLEIEAWINPYRIRNANYKKELSVDNIVNDYIKTGDAISYNGGIYFDPASKKAQQLIVSGVKEIVQNYNVDGIHFDDYFYPTTDESFDKDSYTAYKKQGGTLSLADWRRENVNQLVKAVYQTVHDTKSNVRFGISPQGNMENNYHKQFIDVALWLSQTGYVDYICPQVYFGFDNETSPYAETVAQWDDMIKIDSIDLYIGLAPYKVGVEDTWAGAGKAEWQKNSDLLSRMVSCAREEKSYQGFVLFRYDSVFEPAGAVKNQVNEEIQQLKELLQ